jgi:hypothetical protein
VRTTLAAEFGTRLRAAAPGYAHIAMANVVREYPAHVDAVLVSPDDPATRPRQHSPAFYGSCDWTSSVQMHWLLVRLLRQVPAQVPWSRIRGLLDSQLTETKLRAEAAYMTSPAGQAHRPHGWGWALALTHELTAWPGDRDAVRWARAMNPLAAEVSRNLLEWLATARPSRSGATANAAFSLSRALPYARMLAGGGEPELAAAIASAALRWYYSDIDYPASFEPAEGDVLSPALAEAELMAALLPPEEFPRWLSRFLPGLASSAPHCLFAPARAPGLNLTRAWCWRRLAESLPADDPRVLTCSDAALRHADAGLPPALSGDYALTHYLPALAVLLLS